MSQDLRTVYLWIVDETMSKAKADFVHHGVEESVLLAIRRKWEEEMKEKGLLNAPPSSTASTLNQLQASRDAAGPPGPSYQVGAKRPYDGAGPSQSLTMPYIKPEPGVSPGPTYTLANSQVLSGLVAGQRPAGLVPGLASGGVTTIATHAALQHARLATQQASTGGIQQTGGIPMQRPVLLPGGQQVVMLTQQQLAAIRAQAGGPGGVINLAAAPLQQRATMQLGTHMQPAVSAAPAGGMPGVSTAGGLQPAAPRIPQSDGPGDDEGAGEEQEDDPDGEDGEEELEPVGEHDPRLDDPEDEAILQEEQACENSIFCCFDKVHRSKNKWKCNLRMGVVSIDGKDFMFNKAVAEMEFR